MVCGVSIFCLNESFCEGLFARWKKGAVKIETGIDDAFVIDFNDFANGQPKGLICRGYGAV